MVWAVKATLRPPVPPYTKDPVPIVLEDGCTHTPTYAKIYVPAGGHKSNFAQVGIYTTSGQLYVFVHGSSVGRPKSNRVYRNRPQRTVSIACVIAQQ